ncbi:hypothetical protein LguiA_003657 [Lonicera macranthoides]
MSNCLPTMSAFWVKQVVEEGICPLCNLASKTEFHALVLYQYARQVWNASRFGDRLGTNCSLTNWWSQACFVNAKKDMEEMANIFATALGKITMSWQTIHKRSIHRCSIHDLHLVHLSHQKRALSKARNEWLVICLFKLDVGLEMLIKTEQKVSHTRWIENVMIAA